MWQFIPTRPRPEPADDPSGRGGQPLRVAVTPDGLYAVASRDPSLPIDLAIIQAALQAAGIRAGVRQDVLEQILRGESRGDVVIAVGRAPKAPRPATWTPTLALPASEGEPLACPDCRGFMAVREGQPLARRQPAEPGHGGWTVGGEILEAPAFAGEASGPVVLGDGCRTDPRDPDLAVACRDGAARLVGHRLSVTAMALIDGDAIARQTVHINGPVLVRGPLTPGTQLSATGDVHVWGNVEGASIETGGHLIIHGGVVGQGCARLVARGSISAHFIESAEVEAGESVLVVDQLLRSQVTALDSVILSGGQHAQIAGGTVRAGRTIRAAVVGSRGEVRTIVEVGSNPDIQKRLWDLQRGQQASSERLNSLSRALLKVKLHGMAEISSTQVRQLEESREVLLGQMAESELQITRLSRRMRSGDECQVEVTHRIFGGAKLRIGDHFSHIDQETDGVNYRMANGQLHRLAG